MAKKQRSRYYDNDGDYYSGRMEAKPRLTV